MESDEPNDAQSPEPPAGLQFDAIVPSYFGNEYEVAYPFNNDERPKHVNKLLPSHEKHKTKCFFRRHTSGRIHVLEKRLREAANESDWSSLCRLIDDGVDPSCADSKGRTALHYAATHGNEAIVKTLLVCCKHKSNR